MQIADDFARVGKALEQAMNAPSSVQPIVLSDDQLNSIVDKLADRIANQRKRLMTYSELSESLSISEATIRRHKNAGVIPSVQVGDTVRFDFDAVVEALSKNN